MRDEDGPHARLLGAEDVVPEPVADEDALGWLDVERRGDGRERLLVRLRDRHLARVGSGVEEVDELVAPEDLLVMRAGPHRVAQDPDLQAHRAQLPHERHRVRVGDRVGCPEVEVVAEGSQMQCARHVDAEAEEHRLECTGAHRPG